jgi:hypothetical protein
MIEKMTFLEMTNMDSRIDETPIDDVWNFVDADAQMGQIADRTGDFVVDFNLITPVYEIETTEDLLKAIITVDTSIFD